MVALKQAFRSRGTGCPRAIARRKYSSLKPSEDFSHSLPIPEGVAREVLLAAEVHPSRVIVEDVLEFSEIGLSKHLRLRNSDLEALLLARRELRLRVQSTGRAPARRTTWSRAALPVVQAPICAERIPPFGHERDGWRRSRPRLRYSACWRIPRCEERSIRSLTVDHRQLHLDEDFDRSALSRR